MKILILTNIPSPYRVSFYNELGKLVDVTVLFERQTASDRDEKWNSEEFEFFNGIFLNGKEIGADASISTGYRKYLKEKQFDIFILSGYSSPTVMMAIGYCRRHKIPYWVTSDGAFSHEESGLKRALKTYLIGGATAGLATNDESRRYLTTYGLPQERIYIYPFTSLYKCDICPAVPTEFEKQTIRRGLGISERKIVLSVGRFIPVKGYDLLLQSWKSAQEDWGLYIVGGQELPEYRVLIEQMNLTNVHFIDFLGKESLKKYYMASDVFVLNTKGDVWGLVINEAMACGLPVITTDRCGAGSELVQNGVNGYIVPAEETKLLSEKIKAILEDDSLCMRMSYESLKKIAEYTFENMAQRHIDIFKEYEQTSEK